MKRLLGVALAMSFITPLPAVAADTVVKVGQGNTSKLNGYMQGKSCVSASKTLASKGWLPHRDPNNLPAAATEQNANKKIFNKYKELHTCAGTGYGLCEARYTKGDFNLIVNYDAKGGSSFESESCSAVSYSVSTDPFDGDVDADDFDRQLIEYMNKRAK